MSAQATQSVQCFGKKKTATAVAHCKAGKGLIRVNGKPLGLVEPQIMRFKVYEPVLILGLDKFGTCEAGYGHRGGRGETPGMDCARRWDGADRVCCGRHRWQMDGKRKEHESC